MKLVRLIAVASMLTGLLLVSACSSKHKSGDPAMADNAAYRDEDAQTLGLGDEAGFGGEGSNKTSLADYHRVYYFDFDSNMVRDNDKPAIVANARKLASNGEMKAVVEGHTDPRGSREYNIGLGERRAKAVAKLLTANGAKSHQIRVVSYGAQKPAATGHTEADYQLDRRSVLDYLQS